MTRPTSGAEKFQLAHPILSFIDLVSDSLLDMVIAFHADEVGLISADHRTRTVDDNIHLPNCLNSFQLRSCSQAIQPCAMTI